MLQTAPRRARALGRTLLALVVLALPAACARFHSSDLPGDESYISFVNQSLDQADVYAVVSGGDAVRVGTVLPGATTTLTVPGDLVARGPLDIVARLVGSRRVPRTGPVSFSRGERLQVTLSVDETMLTVLPAGS
jgi:hypothetical protein